VQVAYINDKMRKGHLIWFCHVEAWSPSLNSAYRIKDHEVPHNSRNTEWAKVEDKVMDKTHAITRSIPSIQKLIGL